MSDFPFTKNGLKWEQKQFTHTCYIAKASIGGDESEMQEELGFD